LPPGERAELGRPVRPVSGGTDRRLVFRMTDLALCPGPESAEYMRRHHPRCEVVDTGGKPRSSIR
jgi:hypothetical protein